MIIVMAFSISDLPFIDFTGKNLNTICNFYWIFSTIIIFPIPTILLILLLFNNSLNSIKLNLCRYIIERLLEKVELFKLDILKTFERCWKFDCSCFWMLEMCLIFLLVLFIGDCPIKLIFKFRAFLDSNCIKHFRKIS